MILAKPLVGMIARGDVRLAYLPLRNTRPKDGARVCVKASARAPIACHVIVRDVEHARLGDVTFEQARAAGFRTTDEFKVQWVWFHERQWAADRIADEEPDGFELARFEKRWAPRDAWAVTFDLDTSHVPRFLAARPAPDYVSNEKQALEGEPEAVSEAEQKAITERAGMEYEQWRAVEARAYDERRAVLSAEERIKHAEAKARRLGRDVSRELWLVRTMMHQGRPAQMIHARLDVLERKAFRAAA